MAYYIVRGDGSKKFSKSLADLRADVFVWLAFQEGNMEMSVPIFSDDGKVAEFVYLKYVHDICFILYYRTRDMRTFRSYHPLCDVLVSDIKPDEVDWIEILTMRGKQMCMTGGLGT